MSQSKELDEVTDERVRQIWAAWLKSNYPGGVPQICRAFLVRDQTAYNWLNADRTPGGVPIAKALHSRLGFSEYFNTAMERMVA